jgi:hypothetical protein
MNHVVDHSLPPKRPFFHIDVNGIITLPNGKLIKIHEITVMGETVNLMNFSSQDKVFQNEIINEISKLLYAALKNDKQEIPLKISLSGSDLTLTTVTEEKLVVLSSKRLNKISAVKDKIINTVNLNKEEKLKKHTFTKHVPGFLLTTTLKIITKALGIIPLIFIGIGKVLVGAYTFFATCPKRNLQVARDHMKGTEEQNKFTGLRNISTQFVQNKDSFINNITNQNKIDLHSNATSKNKTTRHILRVLANNGAVINQAKVKEVTNLVNTLKAQDFVNKDSLENAILRVIPELKGALKQETVSLILKELFATKKENSHIIDKDIAKLQKLIEMLENAIPTNFAAANQLVTKQLRELILSPTYQALRENPENEYVKLIHKLSSGIWNDVKALSAYQQFSKTVIPTSIHLAANYTPRIILEEAHNRTREELYTDHGYAAKALYAITHTAQAIGSAASEGGVLREIAGAMPFIGNRVYDSHQELNNNPSLQGTTKATIDVQGTNVKGKINNCYGGCPTEHDQIAPEFEALAQAAENNQFAKIPDNTIPSMVAYTNLQNIENQHGEGERSFATMQMNTKYPLSVHCMTLAKDSDFYKMGGKYKHGQWTEVDNVEWKGPLSFGQELLAKFTEDKCFQYGDRTVGASANGIYLPGDKEYWENVLKTIINQANTHFAGLPTNINSEKGLSAAKKRGAYTEYVYTMIQQVTELKLAQDVAIRTGNTEPLITAIRACKENIDRGGAENAKYLYINLFTKEDGNILTKAEKIELVTAALECRALSARDRVILEDRLPQILAFIEHFDQSDEIRRDIGIISGHLGIKLNSRPDFIPNL